MHVVPFPKERIFNAKIVLWCICHLILCGYFAEGGRHPLLREDSNEEISDMQVKMDVDSSSDENSAALWTDCKAVSVTLKLWPLAVGVYLVFATTLTIFPGAVADAQVSTQLKNITDTQVVPLPLHVFVNI